MYQDLKCTCGAIVFFVHCSFATLWLPSSSLAGFPDIFDAGIKIFEKL